MTQTPTQELHVAYTRNEWTHRIPLFVFLLSYLKEKNIKTIADLGANVGEVSNVFLEQIPTLEYCYLFEPQIDNFNFIKNKFKDTNKIISYNYGIYYGKKESHLYRQDANVGGYSVEENITKEKEIVQLRTLESFNIPNINFIKIDIEGAEWNFIQNSTQIHDIDYILVECHKHGFDKNLLINNSEHDCYVQFLNKYLPNHTIKYRDNVDIHQYFLEKKN